MNPCEKNSLFRLIKLVESISEDPGLIDEIAEEIQSGIGGAICKMIKQKLQENLFGDLGAFTDIFGLIFKSKTISEIDLYTSPNLNIKCFIMPKAAIFPLHDHPNKILCTGIIHGKVKYLSLNSKGKNWYRISRKGEGKKGNVLFGTLEFRNIHSILAVEDTIMIDIFMDKFENQNESNLYLIKKKIGKDFLLQKTTGHHC